MQSKQRIKRKDLLPEMNRLGLDLKDLNQICDTVENMNDNDLLGVVVDTLLDLRDILRLAEGDPGVQHYVSIIEARYAAVINNIKVLGGYGVTTEFGTEAKLKRAEDLKSLLNPLVHQAKELRKKPEIQPE